MLRYLAKLTINPALAHGLAHEVGSLQPGRMADIVLWSPASFGAKPYLVLKSGLPAWGTVGDPNSVVDVAEPRRIAAQFGGIGGAAVDLAVLFTNGAAVDAGADVFPTRRRRVAVRGCRDVGLAQMVHAPRDAPTWSSIRAVTAYASTARRCAMEPVESVPLSRLYFL